MNGEPTRAGPDLLTPALLTVTNLDAFYGDFQALFDVSLVVRPGEIVAVIGSNGAGKSTLLKAIVGLVPAARVRITFDEDPIGGNGTDDIARRGIFLVPEGRRIFPSLSVEENLLIGAYNKRSGPWNLDRVFGLFPSLERRRRHGGTELSGGEQQMLAIGRGLMANPRLLLLDELSLGLAPIIVKGIYAVIDTILAEGITLVIVEQDIQQATAVADRVYCLQRGRVALESATSELDKESLVAAYFGIRR
ncbi:MAG TPA: ABC transporter ATP-binding protein [Acidimicrobiia bacterium]|nr:ABC transporter ATP-binding protein [Acidimicrobiia bacterium]